MGIMTLRKASVCLFHSMRVRFLIFQKTYGQCALSYLTCVFRFGTTNEIGWSRRVQIHNASSGLLSSAICFLPHISEGRDKRCHVLILWWRHLDLACPAIWLLFRCCWLSTWRCGMVQSYKRTYHTWHWSLQDKRSVRGAAIAKRPNSFAGWVRLSINIQTSTFRPGQRSEFLYLHCTICRPYPFIRASGAWRHETIRQTADLVGFQINIKVRTNSGVCVCIFVYMNNCCTWCSIVL